MTARRRRSHRAAVPAGSCAHGHLGCPKWLGAHTWCTLCNEWHCGMTPTGPAHPDDDPDPLTPLREPVDLNPVDVLEQARAALEDGTADDEHASLLACVGEIERLRERPTVMHEWPKTTPTGHVYVAPTTYDELRSRHTDAAQASVECWVDAECPPEPTWEMVGLAHREVERLTEANAELVKRGLGAAEARDEEA